MVLVCGAWVQVGSTDVYEDARCGTIRGPFGFLCSVKPCCDTSLVEFLTYSNGIEKGLRFLGHRPTRQHRSYWVVSVALKMPIQ